MIRALAQRCMLIGATGLLLSGCAQDEDIQIPIVIKIVRTINSYESVSSEDYMRLRASTDDVINQVKGVDPSIRPQLSLSTRKNFVDEIKKQTRSGFGPDIIITDSETALELYKEKLVDPIKIPNEDQADTPDFLYDLATAKDGKLVGRPVNQFIQLACYNKDKLESSPKSLEELRLSSTDSTFGFALQLKDLFWSVEAFDAGIAMEAALNDKLVGPQLQKRVTNWLHWLESASYQQNIRFLNNQRGLREALTRGDLDWITCWSSSLLELKEKMKDRLGVAGLPRGPSQKIKATTKLQVWAVGRNSSAAQRAKALVMLDFISKPWAQKTYALKLLTSMPVNRKAAKIVASKIPGGASALTSYARQASNVRAARGQVKARVFRDPARYETISDALLDTIYDIRTPEESTEDILNSLRESR